MARNPNRVVLYEVIQKNRSKVSLLERARRAKKVKKRSMETEDSKNPFDGQSTDSKGDRQGQNWPGKPNAVLIAKRRIRLGIGPLIPPRPVVVGVLGLLIVAAVVFGLVKLWPSSGTQAIEAAGSEAATAQGVTTDVLAEATQTPDSEQELPVRAMGDHVIVITQVLSRHDLEPVQEYFAKNGIATVIDKRGEYYFLLTREKYGSTKREGSTGYAALQKIKRIGAGYEAPEGYGTFGPRPFQDAYGMKIR